MNSLIKEFLGFISLPFILLGLFIAWLGGMALTSMRVPVGIIPALMIRLRRR